MRPSKPAIPRVGKPWVWVTWITGLLAGDAHCYWAAWFRAHFEFDKLPRDGNLRDFKIRHGAMVRDIARTYATSGWFVTIEDQNDLKAPGHTAVISGKPDIIATRGRDARIVDAKSGRERDSDVWQVIVYLIAWPLVQGEAVRGWTITGEVAYPDRREPVTLTAVHRAELKRVMGIVAGANPPPRVPSPAECARCNIGRQYCPDRVERAPDPTDPVTEDW